jgi:DNA-binding NarL/FixJ family response regulator
LAGRLLLIGQPGLANDCLRNTLSENGYDVASHSLHDAYKQRGAEVDLVVISMNHYQPKGVAIVRQRVDEVRDTLPHVSVMALFECVDGDAMHDLNALGLEALVVGPLSAKIALATIHLVLLSGGLVRAEIHLKAGRVSVHDDKQPPGQPDPRDNNGFLALGNFTGREVALLTRLREGMQNKVIARELGITESTVKVHLRNIMTKLHASNRTQVAYMLTGNKMIGGLREDHPQNLESAAIPGLPVQPLRTSGRA